MPSPAALVGHVDAWQRRHRLSSVAYAVVKKFSDDQANLLVVGLGWYGFTAIYPLLLVVVSIFGFIGVASLGSGIVNTLHQFPVIGDQFSVARGARALHGSTLGLIIGLAGLAYGAQGVTQVAERSMARVWNLPSGDRPAFAARLGRSLAGLIIIGGAFVINALIGSVATAAGHSLLVSAPIVVGMLVLNVGLYLAAFRVLTPGTVTTGALVPGAATAAVAFTLLITVGTGLIEHQLRNESATYGAFASVIGTVAFLLLLAKITIYAAELNPVLARSLAPRSLTGTPTDADRRVWALLEEEQRRRPVPAAPEADGADQVEPDPALRTDRAAAADGPQAPPPGD